MRSLRELLDAVPLPPAEAGEVAEYALPNASLLGADLPPGHVHLWSGPPGAGKTAFLLGLLHDAARHGRPVVLATYDLPAATLALRLLAMASGVPLRVLEGIGVREGAGVLEGVGVPEDGGPSAHRDVEARRLTPDEARAASRARARLRTLPFSVLEARGLGVASIDDRLLRSGTRASVLGIDYLEAIVRPEGHPLSSATAELSDLAARRFLAVVCASRAPLESILGSAVPPDPAPDRVGRLSPAAGEAPEPESAAGATVACATKAGATKAGASSVVEAKVVENRHGGRPSCRLRVDAAAGRLLPADDETASG